MEDQESLAGQLALLKQVTSQLVLVIEVDGSVDVTTLVLVFKPAINHHVLIVLVLVLAIEHIYEGIAADPGNAIRLTFLEEVWKNRARNLVDIHDGLKTASWAIVFLIFHEIAWILEHAEGSPKLLPRPD